MLATVAGAALADVLDFPLLYVLIALVGVLTLCYDVAYQSGLPSLVHEDHLLAANTRLQSTQAVASGVGPALGGALAQVASAPFALLIDAVSYLLSGVTAPRLSRIRPQDPRTAVDLNAGTSSRETWSQGKTVCFIMLDRASSA